MNEGEMSHAVRSFDTECVFVALGGALSTARISVAVSEPSDWRPARRVVPLFGLAALSLIPWIDLRRGSGATQDEAFMEPSRRATGRSRSQKPQLHTMPSETVAEGCDRLPIGRF
jgi:hypothetical protein